MTEGWCGVAEEEVFDEHGNGSKNPIKLFVILRFASLELLSFISTRDKIK